MSLEQLEKDIVVGRMVHGVLQTQVSVRGGKTIVLAYSNTAKMQAFEVGYSPKAAGEFNEMIARARVVVEGKG